MKHQFNKTILLVWFGMMSVFTSVAQHTERLIANWEFLQQDLGGIWEAVRSVGAGSPEAVPLWQSVNLPHCVNATDAVDPDRNYYQGPSWYRTHLRIDNPYRNGRTILHFEGAGQKTDVYVYTTKVGSHRGGYDEFQVDITEAVAAFVQTEVCRQQFNGKVPVSIRTDNTRDLELMPSDLSDFNLYGGIYRYLNLVYLPPVSVDQIFVSPTVDAKGNQAQLNLKTRFYNPLGATEAAVTVTLKDPGGKMIYQADQHFNTLKGDLQLPGHVFKKPVLWSPDQPQLYMLQVSVQSGGNTYIHTQRIGFRHVFFEPKGPFYMNGKRLLLKGTHRHEDHAGVGAAMTEEMIRAEMLLIKAMGANFIRLGHYQQSRQVLQLCDSLGILVWEEIPWCRGGLGGKLYQEQGRSMLRNMIEQHFNHPSIIIWGLGNENDWPGDFPDFNKDSIRSYMKTLHADAHALDTGRKTAIRRCDFCKDIIDIYSPSIWAGWYRGLYTEYKEISRKEFGQVDHFLHVEYGGDSHAGRHAERPDKALQKVNPAGAADERTGDASLHGGSARVSKDGDWSESYIVNLFDWHLKE